MTSTPPTLPRRQLTDALRLVPVVEFEPGRYARKERVLPDGASVELPEAWHRLWCESLADAGIRGLEPLVPGSWLVPVEQLTDVHTLRTLVGVELDMLAADVTEAELDEVAPFSGGHVLLEGSDVIIEPRCCSDLKDLASWRRLAAGQVEGFWNGHPLLVARMEDDRLILQELESFRGGMPLREWSLSPAALARTIAPAAAQLDAFALRLASILEEGLTESMASALAQRLAGVAGQEDGAAPGPRPG